MEILALIVLVFACLVSLLARKWMALQSPMGGLGKVDLYLVSWFGIGDAMAIKAIALIGVSIIFIALGVWWLIAAPLAFTVYNTVRYIRLGLQARKEREERLNNL